MIELHVIDPPSLGDLTTSKLLVERHAIKRVWDMGDDSCKVIFEDDDEPSLLVTNTFTELQEQMER